MQMDQLAIELGEVTMDPLEEYEHLFRTLFENSDEGIMVLQPGLEGRILEANYAAADMHGRTIEEMARLKASDLHPVEELPKVAQTIERVINGEWVDVEHEHVRKDGSKFPVRYRACSAYYLGARVMVLFARDVSDEEHIKRALRQCARELADRTGKKPRPKKQPRQAI